MNRPTGGCSNEEESDSDQDSRWIVVCLRKCIEVVLKIAERTVVMFASVVMKMEYQAYC